MRRTKRAAPPPLAFPAIRCLQCGGEMAARSSRVLDVQMFDPASGKTFSQRRQRFYRCKVCGAHRLANAPCGDIVAG